MNQTWRISTIEKNLSGTVIPSVGNVGATVIKSSKGPLKPKLIAKGNEQRIINLFGKPSATYPNVWDAIQFNQKADVWISAPSKNAKYGGVLVTSTGTKQLTSGITSLTTLTFTEFPVDESIGTGDGSTATFIFTLTDKNYYNNSSVGITVDAVSINVTASDATTEILTTSPNVGSGTYVRSTGVLTFTFNSAPTNGQVVKVTYNTDRSADAYFALFSANPQGNDLSVKITKSSSNIFTIKAYLIDGTSVNELPDSAYIASATAGTKDGFGNNIYLDEIFLNDDFITVSVNSALTVSTFVDDTSTVLFSGGTRGDAITITELTSGWNYFQNSNTYPADIFFDCTADSGIPVLFGTLRSTYQLYSIYILPLPNQNYATAKVTKQTYSLSNRGVYFYWNWGKVRDIYNNSFLYSPLIGRVAGKHADMVNVYNGLAPSWIDEDGHGGQLGSGITEMVWDATESELKDADENQINPIVFTAQYGVIIVSQRTSLTELSDYSWIAHSRVADYIINNVVIQVLPYQLTKLNDIQHRSIVQSKCETIVNPLLASPYGLLSEALVVCDESNNTPTTLAKREFNLAVYVKFTPFSETIKFVFTNVGQQTTVEEVAGI